MKNKSFLSALVALSLILPTLGSVQVRADYQSEVLADGPILYYPLNESVGPTAQNLGVLGAAADGAIDPEPDVLLGQTSASSALGTGIRLDYGIIRVPDLGQGPLDQVTIEVWINRQEDPGPGGIYAIYANDGFQNNTLHYNLNLVGPAGPQFQFAIASGGAHPQFMVMWPTNEWHHLVTTRDGTTSTVRVYLDGRFIGEGTKGAGPEFTDGNIGAWGSTRNLPAFIDEFAVYPTVLSEERIAAHFQAAQVSLNQPEIIIQPEGGTVFVGDAITLSSVARGQALSFQWFKDNVAIAGATTFTYTIDPISAANAGTYTLQVSNEVKSVMSSNAVLEVSGAPKPVSLISHFTFDTGTVVNTTDLRNEVAGRLSGQFRDASAGFAPAAPTISTADKKVGDGALELNGSTFLQIFDEAAMNRLPAYTLAAWVKVNELTGDAAIFSPDGLPKARSLTINALASGVVRADFDADADDFLEAPTPEGWFHVAFTHDANAGVTSAILYINGVAVGNHVADLPGNLTEGGTTFGSYGWANRRLNGLLDDARFYDGALTAAQIAALPGGVVSTPTVTLLSHFTFDTDSVANTTELRNAVAERQNGIFRDATTDPAFEPAPPTLSTADKKVGDGALELNGNTYLQLPVDAALNGLSAYSLAAWVKVNVVEDPCCDGIFMSDVPQAGYLHVNTYPNGTLQAWYDADGDDFLGAPLPSGWFHLAITHDATPGVTQAVLYINGIAVANHVADIPGDLGKASSIGGWAQNGRRLDGLIDDIRIYSGALTAAEIAALPGGVVLPQVAITAQPSDAVVIVGQTVNFSVTATGPEAVYQWLKGGQVIPGATNPVYTIPPATLADNGTVFAVQVSNAANSLTSSNAVLTVVDKPTGDYASNVLGDSPIVYYRLNETAGPTAANSGSLGAAADGTFTDTGVTLGAASAAAGLGTAITLNGASGAVIVPALGIEPLSQVTLEMWLKRTADNLGLVALYANDDWSEGALHLNQVEAGPLLEFAVNGNGPSPSPTYYPRFSLPWPIQEWHHFAAVYDTQAPGAQVSLYLDGILRAQGDTGPGDIALTFTAGSVGAWNASRLFTGLIDEFAIYPTNLSSAQILRHFAAGIPSVETKPVISFSRSGSQLILSWTATGFALQENANLSNSAGWTDVAGGTTSPVTVTVGDGAKFYRLKK